MKRIITGATGFIGRHLVQKWLSSGHEVVAIGRNRNKILQFLPKGVQAIEWQELNAQGEILFANAEIVVNLAGANIGTGRWTMARQQEILQSRVAATHQVAIVCAKLGLQSPALFNANGIGIYGVQQPTGQDLPPAIDEKMVIDNQPSLGFLAKVAREWESAALPAKNAGVRVVYMRFGAVLDPSGGALQQLNLPFRLGLGGPIGSGQQPFSWISLTDLGEAIEFLCNHPEVNGPVNFVAPGAVSQKQFAIALGQALNRPALLPMPAFLVKLLFGQMGEELLLAGQHVYPSRLLELGYQFKYPEIHKFLKQI